MGCSLPSSNGTASWGIAIELIKPYKLEMTFEQQLKEKTGNLADFTKNIPYYSVCCDTTSVKPVIPQGT